MNESIAHTQATRLGLESPALLPLSPGPADRMNSVTFVPSGHGTKRTTAVFVHALSFPPPPWGMVVEVELPAGQFGCQIGPVVIHESLVSQRTQKRP